jgi:predicted RNase H-like HicB family nuclease
MKHCVVVHPSEEGFAVACPDLPGCWSQGATEEEALANIGDAIEDYLAVIQDASDRLASGGGRDQ